MQQISAGSEEASGATQESLAVVTSVNQKIKLQQELGAKIESTMQDLQTLVISTSEGISDLVENVQAGSTRQASSVGDDHPARSAGRRDRRHRQDRRAHC